MGWCNETWLKKNRHHEHYARQDNERRYRNELEMQRHGREPVAIGRMTRRGMIDNGKKIKPMIRWSVRLRPILY